MKLDAREIKELVTETETKRADWAIAAQEWQKMWELDRYADDRTASKDLDGIEQIVTPDPFNIIQLLTRFVSSEMRIEIPALSVKDTDDKRTNLLSEWLIAFDQRSNRQQGRNLTDDKVWHSGVRGRGISQTIWVQDELKELGLDKKRLPILTRNLDSFNAAVERGAFGADYGYHKYKAKRQYIQQQYPKYKLPERFGSDNIRHGYFTEEWEVIDFWWRDRGAVWHAVSIDGKYAKNPVKTEYPEIPFIEWRADGAPIEDELAQALSILHPIRNLWKAKCDYVSKVGTGLLYYFDPLMVFTGLNPGQKIELGPGGNLRLNQGQTVDAFRPEPNVPMAEALLNMIQQGIDQATFPGVLYGDPGSVTAGYAINNLSQQAQNRAATIRNNIEGAIEAENELKLALVEIFGGDEGVEIWGGSRMSDRSRPIRVSAKEIKGNYANEVRLIPEQPMDDNGRIMTWLQLVEKGIISKATMRDRGVNVALPRDEATRIAYERALDMPEIQAKHTLRAMQAVHEQEDWELVISGTPLQQVHEGEMQWRDQKEQEEEAAKEARRQEKMQQQMMEQQMAMQQMGPGGPMPMGPNSSMNMPMGADGFPLPPGMPPGMPMPGGPPSMPPMDPMMMGQPGPLPGMPPMGPSPDMGAQTPGLPGMPPEAAGQFTPEMLGIPPQAPPGQFDQMLGGPPMSEEELLRQMTGGQVPPMM